MFNSRRILQRGFRIYKEHPKRLFKIKKHLRVENKLIIDQYWFTKTKASIFGQSNKENAQYVEFRSHNLLKQNNLKLNEFVA